MVNFLYRPLQEMLVVLEEGNHPLLHYPKFNMFAPWRLTNGKH